jgi:hypothetical protein
MGAQKAGVLGDTERIRITHLMKETGEKSLSIIIQNLVSLIGRTEGEYERRDRVGVRKGGWGF